MPLPQIAEGAIFLLPAVATNRLMLLGIEKNAAAMVRQRFLHVMRDL
jgi:hypothetical protein